ncbi:hypothetical protein M422DRAFT_262031 [Sphaerobolus stellatus SS14]|uniref:Uncharacterized protein n=1 Tax=Sphaerobolus stellatus (strain SS14) TaxID=990650 RepID=A0A0C9UL61_SPHS4|nr:hypothetical protein M422DRAFT_262031 [Sphaerobolus stellatus SS14]
MAHGVEPILPFDITEATFLIPKLDKPLSHEDLIAIQRVLKARYASIAQFEKENANLIIDYDFAPGSLVLVRNSRIETDLSRKSKPRYLGPMVVIRRTRNKAYILAELDGAIHKNPYAAFRLIPYYPLSHTINPITSLVDATDIPQDDDLD